MGTRDNFIVYLHITARVLDIDGCPPLHGISNSEIHWSSRRSSVAAILFLQSSSIF